MAAPSLDAPSLHDDSATDPEATADTPSRFPSVVTGALAVLILVAPALLVTWACRPGYMNADTLHQYNMTQSAPLNDWYGPVLLWLWDGALAIGVGRPTFVLFGQTLLLTLGFSLALRAVVGRLVASVLAAVLLLSPPVLSQVMLLGRDTWLTCFVVAQAGTSIRWAGATGRWRPVWLGLSVASGLLAVASRQNGAALVIFVAAATAYRWLSERSERRGAATAAWRRVALGGAIACGAAVVAFAAVGLVGRAIGVDDTQPEAVLYAYDLAGLSVETGDMLLGDHAFPEQDVAELREHWDPSTVNPLLVPADDPVVHVMWDPVGSEEVADDWREAVPDNLGEYASLRWGLFERIVGISSPPTVVMHPGVDDNPWDFSLANPDGDEIVRDYVGVLATDDALLHGSDAARPIWYLAAGVVASAYLLARRRRTDPGGIEVALLAAGSVAYQATFLLLAMGEGYRYSYPMITCCLLAVVFAVTAAISGRRSGPHEDSPVEGTVATA